MEEEEHYPLPHDHSRHYYREAMQQGAEEGGGGRGEAAAAWICRSCTYHNQASHQVCAMCYTVRPGSSWMTQLLHLQHGNSNSFLPSLSVCTIPRAIGKVLSGALTGVFAVAGACTGAVTGALASRAAQSGLLRGAGLGAVAGAVLSVEVLEASREYWHSERHSGSTSSSPSMTDFIEDLLSGRFVHEFVLPAISAAQRWQLNIADMTYEELYDMFAPEASRIKGATDEFLQSLPQHTVSHCDRVDASGDAICCAICLQELEQGDIARMLPLCKHTFHMKCVDRWLVKHVSCPVCRHRLQLLQ